MHRNTQRILVLLTAAFVLTGSAGFAYDSPRNKQSFDFDWRFHLGDVSEAKDSGFDDSSWRQLNLPHDWSVEHPFSQDHASGTGYLPGGVGWYRKTFTAPPEWQGKEVSIYFDGVQRNSQVWVNGHKLGGRPYGYIPFSFRLTPLLKVGEENVVAVRVARENVADSRWYPGTGVYRHVWLHVTEPVHVAQWGTFVTTPRVSAEKADVTISNEIVNDSEKRVEATVVTKIMNSSGASLPEQTIEVSLEPGESRTVAQWQEVPNPSLWSPDSPTQYAAVTQVRHGKSIVDEVSTPFGIRTFHFDADKGFFLNGQPMLIKGLCLHHDAGVVGAAVPDRVLERRLQQVKQLGANAVRCSHNPMAEELYALCDKLGLLVMDEAFDEWELGKRKWVKGRNVGRAQRFGYNEDFEEWAERDAADMVRRSRNHPSIILWSIGNEIDYPGDPYAHPEFFDPAAPPVEEGSPQAARLAVVAPRLIAAVKRHDPTRPVTMALSNMPASNDIGLASMLDVVGYNYQEQFYDADHAEFPARVIYGSENGQGPQSWQVVEEKPFVSSLYYWVGFDFLGEAGEWPNHGSRSGVFDTRGYLKEFSYGHLARWSDRPVVRLLVAGRAREDGRRRRGFRFPQHPRLWRAEEEGDRLRVLVLSNCDNVELKLNGDRIELDAGGRGPFLQAVVPYTSGELRAVGVRDGQHETEDSLRTPGAPARLELATDRSQLVADGQDVAHLDLQLVDEH
ncbi:MAG: DUF4982 domain-containing protein, partial [Planctomycetales bacterium]|nr:DUF4982 domain-containing protein [Planctomycetales bacterium]